MLEEPEQRTEEILPMPEQQSFPQMRQVEVQTSIVTDPMDISEDIGEIELPVDEVEIKEINIEKYNTDLPPATTSITHTQFLSRIVTESQFLDSEQPSLSAKRTRPGSKSPWAKRTATEIFKPVLSKMMDPATPVQNKRINVKPMKKKERAVTTAGKTRNDKEPYNTPQMYNHKASRSHFNYASL